MITLFLSVLFLLSGAFAQQRSRNRHPLGVQTFQSPMPTCVAADQTSNTGFCH